MQRIKRKGNYPKRRLPLDARHYAAIDMLSQIRRPNLDVIARRLGIDRRTLFRWRERPDFSAELTRTIKRKVRARVGRVRQRSWMNYALFQAIKGNVRPMEKMLRKSDML